MVKLSIITVVVLALLVACVYPFASHADGINSLIEVGKSMDSAKRELAEETARFDSIKSALHNGVLQKGVPRQAVWNQFGEPVVMNRDFATNRERWVYKPASSSFFEGERIELLFDARGALDEIEIVTD